MEIRLVRAAPGDAPLIHRMQQEAFAELLTVYQDYETNPGAERLEQVEARLAQPFTFYYLITVDGEHAGAMRVVDKGDAERKRISPLFVLPRFRRRGVAQTSLRLAEALHGRDGWSLTTILQEAGNCRLYERAGYRPNSFQKVINERMTLIGYEK